MNLSGSQFVLALLVFGLCIYMLKICVRDFRSSRGSGSLKRCLYILGAVLSCGVMVFAAILVLLVVLGPLH